MYNIVCSQSKPTKYVEKPQSSQILFATASTTKSKATQIGITERKKSSYI